jgi:hypothetical protein
LDEKHTFSRQFSIKQGIIFVMIKPIRQFNAYLCGQERGGVIPGNICQVKTKFPPLFIRAEGFNTFCTLSRASFRAGLLIAVILLGSLFVSCENLWMAEILGPLFKDKDTAKLYAVGETGPGGGIVFYYNPEGFSMADGGTCHYLEAAPDDALNGTRPFAWAAYGTESYDNVSGTYDHIGSGRQNTDLILAAALPSPETTAPAASACKNYNGGGKTDWFLPSIDELDKIMNSGVVPDVDYDEQAEKYGYWSSTQDGTYYDSACYYRLKEGKILSNNKDFTFNVRPIRAF